MKLPVYSAQGAKLKPITVDDQVFAMKPNLAVVHQAFVAQQANQRAGSASTKTRSEKRGSTAKVRIQKGTGRARQGPNRAPHRRGGGVAFGPKPRSYRQALPKRMKRLAIRSVLSGKVADGRLAGASLFYHESVVENARFTGADGAPWSGWLEVDPEEGSPSVADRASTPDLAGVGLLNGAPLTGHAFEKGLGRLGSVIVTLAVVLFAVSTGISWSYYGDRSVEYLFGSAAIPVYRWVFVAFFFFGAVLPLKAVWTYGDVALGLMTFPNLVAVLLLTGAVARLTVDYLSREHKPYR